MGRRAPVFKRLRVQLLRALCKRPHVMYLSRPPGRANPPGKKNYTFETPCLGLACMSHDPRLISNNCRARAMSRLGLRPDLRPRFIHQQDGQGEGGSLERLYLATWQSTYYYVLVPTKESRGLKLGCKRESQNKKKISVAVVVRTVGWRHLPLSNVRGVCYRASPALPTPFHATDTIM